MKNLAVTGGIRCLAMAWVVVMVSMGHLPAIWVREGASDETETGLDIFQYSSNLQERALGTTISHAVGNRRSRMMSNVEIFKRQDLLTLSVVDMYSAVK